MSLWVYGFIDLLDYSKVNDRGKKKRTTEAQRHGRPENQKAERRRRTE